MAKKPRPGKYTEVPLFHPDTGRSYDRRKWRFDEESRKMQRLFDPVKRERAELPTCPECKHNGREKRPNKVRQDAFGVPLAECKDCLAVEGGKAHQSLAEIPRIVPTRREASGLRVVEPVER